MYRGLVIITLLLISIGPLESNASLTEWFRTLAEQNKIPLSPSPAPSVITSGDPIVKESCKTASASCHQKNMTACFPDPKSGPQGSILVLNDGETSLEVKIMILPANITFEEHISSHQWKKINISANVGVISSIVLNTGEGDCIIQMGAPAPQNYYYQRIPYDTYLTPINGAYLLFVIIFTIGGIWACCNLTKGGRHLDGVPYQELEMGNPVALSSTNVEDAEGWDQDWDDEWDEEKAVKSPGGNHLRSKPANGFTSNKSLDSNGWGNDWDD